MPQGLRPLAPTAPTWSARTDTLLYGLTLLLAFSLPFEPIRSPFTFAGLEVNHLKVLLLATLLVWLAGGMQRMVALRGMWPGALFLAVAYASAVTAPGDRVEAVKFVARLGTGLYALVLVSHVATNWQRVNGLLWAVILGAGASALLGLGEAAGVGVLEPLLGLFKITPTHVGGDLRVSASFQYATIASMFFELVTPLALVVAATASTSQARIAATLLAAMCIVVTVLTITRAGIVALAISLVGILALAWARPSWRSLVLPTVLVGSAMAVALAALAIQTAGFNARLATENDWTWYRAAYSVPASLTVEPNLPTSVTVAARNTGDAPWTGAGEHPFSMSYRWLSADDSAQLDKPAGLVSLPRDVAPGESIDVTVQITTDLPSGDYRLAWGMLQQNVLWFHDRGYPDAETAVQVVPGSNSSNSATIGMSPRTDWVVPVPPQSRAALWSAALRMVAQHPLLGVGPDNFRHMYGSYLGLSAWDERIHANNLYLELLADTGVLGLAAFGLVIAVGVSPLVRGIRARLPVVQAVCLAGLSASILVFFIHGTLDYFLSFTPVYLLFWLVVGLSRTAPELKS